MEAQLWRADVNGQDCLFFIHTFKAVNFYDLFSCAKKRKNVFQNSFHMTNICM